MADSGSAFLAIQDKDAQDMSPTFTHIDHLVYQNLIMTCPLEDAPQMDTDKAIQTEPRGPIQHKGVQKDPTTMPMDPMVKQMAEQHKKLHLLKEALPFEHT